MNLTALAGILSLAQSAFSVAEQYGSEAPQVVKGAETVIGGGKTIGSDLGAIVSGIKAGNYENTEAGVTKALSDVGQLVSGVEGELQTVAGIVAKTPSLPSAASISTLLKAL